MTPWLGPVNYDRTTHFSERATGGQHRSAYYDPFTDTYFRYQHGREICFGGYVLCLYFKADSFTSAFRLVGWDYSDRYARLIDAEGIGMFNRPADFPSGYFTALLTGSGRCYPPGYNADILRSGGYVDMVNVGPNW
ncbi:MAG TPA: hypothetical protein PLV68_15700, partial [Ilumatobacteraceae bacterium]|nr:hypothetical protein [Ilumatobacteraceae bacterium]